MDPVLVELVCMRASQINGCSVCVDGHWRIARREGATDERLTAKRKGRGRYEVFTDEMMAEFPEYLMHDD